jgi:hypothetical protein
MPFGRVGSNPIAVGKTSVVFFLFLRWFPSFFALDLGVTVLTKGARVLAAEYRPFWHTG